MRTGGKKRKTSCKIGVTRLEDLIVGWDTVKRGFDEGSLKRRLGDC